MCFFRKSTDNIRNKHYTITFKRDEELPLEVWTYLVKRRANFKCEECGTSEKRRKLNAHHIKRPEDGGKNILRNGKALCSKCHGKAHTITIPKKKIPKLLMKVIGKRKFMPYMKGIYEEISKRLKERDDSLEKDKELVNKLNQLKRKIREKYVNQ